MTQAMASVKDVAEKLQVSDRTVRRLPIRFIRVGGQRRYDWSDVQKYLDKRASRKVAA
jgi:excisionase family DNA binding protein